MYVNVDGNGCVEERITVWLFPRTGSAVVEATLGQTVLITDPSEKPNGSEWLKADTIETTED